VVGGTGAGPSGVGRGVVTGVPGILSRAPALLLLFLLALPLPASAVTLRGEVRCPDCAGGVGLRLYGEGGELGGPVLSQFGLLEPSPWSLEVAAGTGAAPLFAFRDQDLDGLPDPGTGAVAYRGNPLAIGEADLDELVIDLPALSQTTVLLSGELRCADCTGVGLQLLLALDGSLLARIGLPAPGGWSLELAAGLGDVHVEGFRDADQDGAPDAGTEPVRCPVDPVTVAGVDLPGLILKHAQACMEAQR